MNKDQIKGRAEEVKGNIKEGVGKAVGNDRLRAKGEPFFNWTFPEAMKVS